MQNYKKAKPLLKKAVGLGGADNAIAIRAYSILTQQMSADKRWSGVGGVSKAKNKFLSKLNKTKSGLSELVIPVQAEVYKVEEIVEDPKGEKWEPPHISPASPFRDKSGVSQEEKQAKMARMRAQIAARNKAAIVKKEQEEAADDKACLMFRKSNCFRAGMISLSTHVWFERLTIMMIFANCVSLAMFDPADQGRVRSDDYPFSLSIFCVVSSHSILAFSM